MQRIGMRDITIKLSRAVPPGRYDEESGETRHYLEVRGKNLESLERHGSVLVEKGPKGSWGPTIPVDGVVIDDGDGEYGFWRDGLGLSPEDGKLQSEEVIGFQEAYPDKRNWKIDLGREHAVLKFFPDGHNGHMLSASEKANLTSSQVTVPKSSSSESLGGSLGDAVVGLMERRIPTTFPLPDSKRRAEILSVLEPGDVILETNLSYPGWKRFEHYALDSPFTHAALYEGDGKILEATPHAGVQRSDIEKYFNEPVKMAVVKMPYADAKNREAALESFRSIRGKPYNRSTDFMTGTKFGCTEAVTYALENIPKPISVPRLSFITGHVGVSPMAFTQVEGAEVAYSDKPDYYGDQLHSWPVDLATATLGLGAGFAAAVGGASTLASASLGLIGGGVGYYLSSCVGNWLQKGRFKLFVDGK